MRFLSKTPSFDFMGTRHIFMWTSTLAMFVVIALLFTKGLNYGIDFLGGIEIEVRFSDSVSVANIRSALEEAGFRDLTVKAYGDEGGTSDFLISSKGEVKNANKVADDMKRALIKVFGENKVSIVRVDAVGPKAGAELKKSAILSVIYSMIAVLVYVWFRFDLMYAPGAVFCLVHDVMITVGLFSIFQKEFGLTTLAALLTLVGYSLNDTIVTFDRIRENIGSSGTTNLEAIINRSVNEMLGRTLLTNLTVLFAVLALFWKGGGVVHDFAFTMIVGVFVGSYSTIFVSAPLVIWMDKVIAKRGKAPVRARAPKNA